MKRLFRLGLAALFVALAASVTPVRAADADPLLPADADTVAFINVKQLVGSDVIKKFALEQIKQVLAGQDAKKILDDLGLDPLKDVEKVWVGTSGKNKDDMKGLLIFRGTFDPAKLIRTAEAASKKDGDKFSVIKENGLTLFKFQPEDGTPVYTAIVDKTTVIAASDKKIVAAAFKQTDAKKAPIKDDLNALVKKFDAEKTSLFAVSVVKGKFEGVMIPQQLNETLNLGDFQKVLPKTDTLALAVKVSEEINLEVTFGMKDDDAATDMSGALAKVLDSIKGLVPILAAAEPKAKPLVDVVKTLKTDVKKKDVSIVGKITAENLAKMINPDG